MRDAWIEENLAELSGHLDELRTRLLVIIATLVTGSLAGWFTYPYLYRLLAAPLLAALRAHQGIVYTAHPGEAFFTQCKLSLVVGLVLASPVIVWQLWAFVKPGLTQREQRGIGPLMPAISLLFLAGAALAYFLLPTIMAFFTGYVPAGVSPNVAYENSITFPLKIMLAFGLAFQLPVLVLGLVALRVLTPQMLLQQWRGAVVALAVIAAVVTPTGDPFNWAIVMGPLLVLYAGTVLVAFWVTRRR